MFRRRRLLACGLLAPLPIWLFVTIAILVGYLIYLSFINVGIAGAGGKFVWFDDFANVLDSKRFFQALRNPLFWIVGNGLLQVALAFLAARLLYERIRVNTFLQIWIILPWVIPGVAALIIWRWMLNGIGIVNYALDLVQASLSAFLRIQLSPCLQLFW
jgi:multiple sugar transport system permease protein